MAVKYRRPTTADRTGGGRRAWRSRARASSPTRTRTRTGRKPRRSGTTITPPAVLVPRPPARGAAQERVRGARGVLPAARPGEGAGRPAGRTARSAGRRLRQPVRARDGDPRPHVRPARPALLAGRGREPRRAPVLGAGVLRRLHHGERQDLAVPPGRATALSVPLPRRLERPLLRHARGRRRDRLARAHLLADRFGRRPAGDPGRAERAADQEFAEPQDGAGRTRRPDRGLLWMGGPNVQPRECRGGAVPRG